MTEQLDPETALALTEDCDVDGLMARAAALRDEGHGGLITYSRKVFIPLTQLCRDVCHYCTFAHPPRKGQRAYMTREEVLDVARAGAAAGCKEALFTLGDKPELRYRVAREELTDLGHETTLSYLTEMAGAVLAETGLLPHINAGVMTEGEIAALREVSVSQGLMLESTSLRLLEKGGPHYGSPDKQPEVRLATMRAAGRLAVPFTTGILIGIGETRRERIEALLAIRECHEELGHIQEIIVQNFRAKPGHQDGRRAGTLDRGIAVDDCGGAADLRSGNDDTGTAESQSRRPIGAGLGGLDDWGGVSPRDARPRQSGSAVAASRCAR